MVKIWTEEQIKEVIELYKTTSIRNISKITGHTNYSISILLKKNGLEIKKGNNGNNLKGKRFGRLIVIEDVGRKNGHILWKCECDCGTIKNITAMSLASGKCNSCGCLQKEKAGNVNRTHGDSSTKLFMVWMDMRGRCNRSTHHAYKYYGEKGVSVYKEWDESFICFKDWSITNGYRVGLSIDRIDVDGNYEPSNCRWITHKAQMNNTTRNHKIQIFGEVLNISQIKEKYDLSSFKIYKIIQNNSNYEKDLEKYILDNDINKLTSNITKENIKFYVNTIEYSKENNISRRKLNSILLNGEIKESFQHKGKWYLDSRIKIY